MKIPRLVIYRCRDFRDPGIGFSNCTTVETNPLPESPLRAETSRPNRARTNRGPPVGGHSQWPNDKRNRRRPRRFMVHAAFCCQIYDRQQSPSRKPKYARNFVRFPRERWKVPRENWAFVFRNAYFHIYIPVDGRTLFSPY